MDEETLTIELTVNGERVTRSVPVRQHLVDFLRTELGLTGSHLGCEHGICGACTVRVDGAVLRGCLMLAVQADGAAVETIEGLTESGEIADLQETFERRNALQCGYCTPGMLLTAAELLRRARPASREEIRALMERKLVKLVGRAADLGRPMLYGTTKAGLAVFGLSRLKDLPKGEEFKARAVSA